MAAQSEGLSQANLSKGGLLEGSPSGRRARLQYLILSLWLDVAPGAGAQKTDLQRGRLEVLGQLCFPQQVLLKKIRVVPSMATTVLYDSIYMRLRNRQN